MKHIFAPMNEEYADDIANWHYDGVYSFYDMAADEGDLRILRDTRNWQNIIRAVLNETNELVGWAAFYTEDEEFWLSLGLRPDLIGQGLGEEFVSACLDYAISQYKLVKHTIKLHVAIFNQRAVEVYQRVGFIETSKLVRDTHIGQVDFIEMEKHIPPSITSGPAGANSEHKSPRTQLPSGIQPSLQPRELKGRMLEEQ